MTDVLTSFPMQTILYHSSNPHPIWNPNPILYLLLDGTATVTALQDQLPLPPNRIQLVNPCIVHSITCNGILLQVTIDISYFERFLSRSLHHYFFCSAASETDSEIKASLLHILVQYIITAQGPSGFDSRAASLAFQIMELLQSHFALSGPASSLSQRSTQYLSQAIDYMNLNYTSIRSVSEVADHCHIAESYLSRLFKEYTNISTAAYLERIRLGHACSLLSGSRKSITDIAQICGFPSNRSLSDSFRKQFGILPREFRRQPMPSPTPITENNLMALLLPLAAMPSPKPESKEIIQLPTCSYKQSGPAISNNLFQLLNIGNASRLLTYKTQQILDALAVFKFSYGYLTDLMGPEIMPAIRQKNGSYQYSFTKIDEALDLLLSHKLTPFLNLDTAHELLSVQNRKTNDTSAVKEWLNQLRQFFSHLIQRYGISMLRTWRFTVFSYPYEAGQLATGQGVDTLNRLFAHARHVLTEFDSQLSFYAPPFCAPYSPNLLKAYREFLSGCQDSLPSALLFYVPPVFEDGIQFCCHPSYDGLQILHDSIRSVIKEYYEGSADIHVIEWTPLSQGINYLSDTIAAVPYLARCFFRHHNHFSSVAYAPISDYFDLFPISTNEFYGYSGLMTRSGIRKPSFFLFWILCRFQGNILCQGDGYFVCRDDKLLHIILYNSNGIYAIQDALDFPSVRMPKQNTASSLYFIEEEEKIMTTNNRYAVYEGVSKVYRVTLKNLTHPRYYFSVHSITKDKGNPFQVLLDNGGEEAAHPWEMQNLQNNNHLGWYHQFIVPQNGQYQIEQRLEPNELVQIIISPEILKYL